MGWHELPVPLLEAVAARLGESQDRPNTRLVCQHWCSYMSQSMTCQLETDPDVAAWTDRLDAMSARGMSFSSAEVYVSSRVPADALAAQLQALTRMASLQALTLNMSLVPCSPHLGATPPCVPPTVSLLTSLTALHLVGHNSAPLPAHLRSLMALSGLRSLSFDTYSLRNPHPGSVASVSSLTQLHALTVRFHSRQRSLRNAHFIMEEDVVLDDDVVEALTQLVNLQELHLQRGELSWPNLERLVACLGQLTHLSATLAGDPDILEDLEAAAEQLPPEEALTVIPSSRRHLAPGSPGNPLLSLGWNLFDLEDLMLTFLPIVTQAISGLAPNLKAFTGWNDDAPWPLLLPPDHPAHASLTNLQCLFCTLRNLPKEEAEEAAEEEESDPTSPFLAISVQHLTALRSLSVVINEAIATAPLAHLQAWAAALPALTHLSLHDWDVLQPPSPTLAEGVPTAPVLRISQLKSLELSVAAYLPLVFLPPSLTALQCTCVHFVPVGAMDALAAAHQPGTGPRQQAEAAVEEAPAAAASTTTSTISGTSAQHGTAATTSVRSTSSPALTGASASSAWGGLPQLQSLLLHRCRISEQALQELLVACPQLLSLYLQDLRKPPADCEADEGHAPAWMAACPTRLTLLHVEGGVGDVHCASQRCIAGVSALTALRRLHLRQGGLAPAVPMDAGELKASCQVLTALRRLHYLELDHAFRAVDGFGRDVLQPLPLADFDTYWH